MKKLTLLGAFLAAALALGACSSSSDGGGISQADKDEAIEQLTADGLTQEQAECVVDGVEDALGSDAIETLNSDAGPDSLSAEDQEALIEATLWSGQGRGGAPVRTLAGFPPV
jgi:hypothetical protein